MSEEQIPVTAPFNKKGNIAGTYSFQDEYGKYLLITMISNPLGEFLFNYSCSNHLFFLNCNLILIKLKGKKIKFCYLTYNIVIYTLIVIS